MSTSKRHAWLLAATVLFAPAPLAAQSPDATENKDEIIDIRNLPVIATLSPDKTTIKICSIDGNLASQSEGMKLMWSAFKGPTFDSLHVSNTATLHTDAGNISGLLAAYNETTQRFVAVQLGDEDQQTVLKDTDGKLTKRVHAAIKSTLALCKETLTSAYASWEKAGKPLAKSWPGSKGENHDFGFVPVLADFPGDIKKRHQFIAQGYEDISYRPNVISGQSQILKPQ